MNDQGVLGADVAVDDKLLNFSKPQKHTFPSGTKSVEIAVKFARWPQGDGIGLEVENASGKMKGLDGAGLTEENNRTGE